MKRSLALLAVPLVLLMVAGACASGPSPEIVARGLSPSTTTTSEPLPDNLSLVRITNASFQPAVLNINTEILPIVRWVNLDDVEYTIIARGKEFESPVVPPGGTWEFDFSTLEFGVYRYFIVRGAQTIPGLVDSRPAQ